MSETQTAKRKSGRQATPQPAADLPVAQDARPLDAPAPPAERRRRQVEVVQRRLKSGQMFAAPRQAVPLKDPAMLTRWFNRGISADRFYVAEHQKGWIKVHVSDVASLDAISGYDRTPEGYIVRGPRGEEMLYMMPKSDYRAIQMAKAEATSARLSSDKKRKEATAEAVAAAMGPQAGEFIESLDGETTAWKGPAD